MVKIKCKDCNKEIEVQEGQEWKNRCRDCFINSRTPNQKVSPHTLTEIKSQQKSEEQETKKRIMFGNCLNASGNALAGSCPEPKQHYAYAKELFELWVADELGISKEQVEEELVKK